MALDGRQIVPLGKAGTGGATFFGQSPAATRAVEQMEKGEQRLSDWQDKLLEERLKLKIEDAKETQKKVDLSKYAPKDVWKYDEGLRNDIVKDVMAIGVQYGTNSPEFKEASEISLQTLAGINDQEKTGNDYLNKMENAYLNNKISEDERDKAFASFEEYASLNPNERLGYQLYRPELRKEEEEPELFSIADALGEYKSSYLKTDVIEQGDTTTTVAGANTRSITEDVNTFFQDPNSKTYKWYQQNKDKYGENVAKGMFIKLLENQVPVTNKTLQDEPKGAGKDLQEQEILNRKMQIGYIQKYNQFQDPKDKEKSEVYLGMLIGSRYLGGTIQNAQFAKANSDDEENFGVSNGTDIVRLNVLKSDGSVGKFPIDLTDPKSYLAINEIMNSGGNLDIKSEVLDKTPAFNFSNKVKDFDSLPKEEKEVIQLAELLQKKNEDAIKQLENKSYKGSDITSVKHNSKGDIVINVKVTSEDGTWSNIFGKSYTIDNNDKDAVEEFVREALGSQEKSPQSNDAKPWLKFRKSKNERRGN